MKQKERNINAEINLKKWAMDKFFLFGITYNSKHLI